MAGHWWNSNYSVCPPQDTADFPGTSTFLRQGMIPSKSKYLSVFIDVIETFPVTAGNYLSCTSCCCNIPQVLGQNLLPGRPEHPAKIRNWTGLAEF